MADHQAPESEKTANQDAENNYSDPPKEHREVAEHVSKVETELVFENS